MFRSIRPAVLLALVVAVACTDQPTEPTAGSPIRTTLPPPPAEASVLTGTLGGGDGTGVSAELGYYESPVYSTVTVSGSLSYSGRPDGYLPGSGQIDAAGIQLSNQCDLTVYISWALPTIGSTTTIAPTCWYPARNQGPYSRRMVLAGRIFTYRTYGPPLSCWKYPAPCVSYQGTQTVTVTPEEGNLIVTPSATEVGPGGEIGFTAKAVWAGDGKTAVPLTIREWRWSGSGREVGGGHTTICDPADSNPCWVRVYQSGTVTLEAIVNGKLKTQSVDIEVVGGGCGAGTAPSGVQLAECEPPKPVVTLKCQDVAGSTDITRGEVVTCTLSVDPASTQVTVSGWKSKGADGNEATDPSSGLSWSGRAAISSEVTVTYKLATTEPTTASTTFQVKARPWTHAVATGAIAEVWSPSPGGTAAFVELQYPPTQVTGQLGTTDPWGVHYTATTVAGPTSLISGGPNANWMITTGPYPDLTPVVFLNRGLRREDSFYALQNGRKIQGRDTGDPRLDYYCSARQMDAYLSQTRAHEGSTESALSHVAIYRREAPLLNLNASVEHVLGYAKDFSELEQRDFWAKIDDAFDVWDKAMRAQQWALHDLDGGEVPIACVFRQPQGR